METYSLCSDRCAECTIEVVLLGAAQDGGFPQFGCFCDNCSRVYDRTAPRDTAVSLAIIDHSAMKWYLVEAAPQLHDQCTTIGTRVKGLQLSGVFLSHAHIGHYPGLVFLGKESMNTTRVPVYASADMHGFLQANDPWSVLYRNENITRIDLEEGAAVSLTDGLAVRPQYVIRRRDFTDTFAFFFLGSSRSMFFCPDIDCWDGMDPPLSVVLNNVDVALIDATFYDNNELPGRDMTSIPHFD